MGWLVAQKATQLDADKSNLVLTKYEAIAPFSMLLDHGYKFTLKRGDKVHKVSEWMFNRGRELEQLPILKPTSSDIFVSNRWKLRMIQVIS